MTNEPSTHSGRTQKDKWAHLWRVVEVTVGIAALCGIIGAAFGEIIRYHELRASERQAQAVMEASKLQLEVSRANLGIALMPILISGTPKQQKTAALILSSAAPDLAIALEKSADTPEARKLAQEVTQLSVQAKETQSFNQHLEQARVYQGLQLFGQADREYIHAADSQSSQIKLDSSKIADAKSRFGAGDFEASARVFDEAFSNSSTR